MRNAFLIIFFFFFCSLKTNSHERGLTDCYKSDDGRKQPQQSKARIAPATTLLSGELDLFMCFSFIHFFLQRNFNIYCCDKDRRWILIRCNPMSLLDNIISDLLLWRRKSYSLCFDISQFFFLFNFAKQNQLKNKMRRKKLGHDFA